MPCRLRALGMLSPFGADAAAAWPRFLAGDLDGMHERDDLCAAGPLLVGDFRGELPAIPPSLARYDCRNNAFALQALEGIRELWEPVLSALAPERVGVVMGTSTSGVSDAEAAIAAHRATRCFTPRFHYAQLEFGGLAGFVADVLGARGPRYTLSTACSSGARALASGRSLLRLGLCDAVLAGAADTLCGLTAGGFSALHAVDPGRTNPMSANRRGLNLGEAAAVFLLTPEPGGVQLLGVGESSEAHHMSAPDPEGEGAAAAMRAALADAGAAPEEVLYLNLHGTGTEQNDAMESAAVARVFGTGLACSSTKPLIGHTLGAAGAAEAALCWLLLTESPPDALALPPHCFDGERDPALPPIHLVSKGEHVARSGRSLVMTNSFGFGGNNCTLVLGQEPEAAGEVGAGSQAAGGPARAHAAGGARPSQAGPGGGPWIGVDLLGFAAWAPGLEDDDAWRRWAAAPEAVGVEGAAAVDFLPPMVRRRCTPLTRMMMRAAFEGCPEPLRGRVRTVFASRHGSINESLELLERVVAGKPLSPARFSHTVHNAQAGLFSIAAANRAASSSLAGQEDTLAAAFVEAATHLDREPGRPVLVVVGDAPLSPTFAPLVDEVQAAYAAAFVLATPEGDPALRFAFQGGAGAPWERAWPQALELVRWLHGAEAELEIPGPHATLALARGAGGGA